MIANYGYRDGEGEFYVTIDQDKCAGCPERPCISACPAHLFVEEEDPFGGGTVAAIDDAKRKMLRYECMPCKPAAARQRLPCIAACPCDAVRHSW